MNEINKSSNSTQTPLNFLSNRDNGQEEGVLNDAITRLVNEIFTLSPPPRSSPDKELEGFFLDRYPTPTLEDFPEPSPDPSPETEGVQMALSDPSPTLFELAPASVKKKRSAVQKRDSLDKILKTHLKNFQTVLSSPPLEGIIDATFDKKISKERAHVTTTIKNYGPKFNADYFKTHKDPAILENFENVIKLFNKSSDQQMAGTIKFAGKWPEITALICELIPDIESRVPDIKVKYSDVKMAAAPPKKYIPKEKRKAEAQIGPPPKQSRTEPPKPPESSIEQPIEPLTQETDLLPSDFDFTCDEQIEPPSYFDPPDFSWDQPVENHEDPFFPPE